MIERYVDSRGDLRLGKVIGTVVAICIALMVLFGSFGTVGAGERGIKTRFGAVVGIQEQGLYFKLPFVERMNIMDVKTQTVRYELEEPLFSSSKDLQDVKIATVANYHVDPRAVAQIFQQYGNSQAYEADVIRPIVRDTVKSVASQYTAEELVTKRADFNDKVTAALVEKLNHRGVVVENVNITNFEFSKAFNEAIEAKVTAVQNAEAAKNKLEQVKFEAQQTVEKAKAEAESIRIQAAAITSQGGDDYVKLQAIGKWNGVGCTTQCFGGNTQMPVPFFNLNK